MEPYDYLPSDLREFLFGNGGIPAQAPVDNGRCMRFRAWPSTSGYGAFNHVRERDTSERHHDRHQGIPHLNHRVRPAYNAFEGYDGSPEEFFGHAQPWEPTYAGAAEAGFFPLKPRHTYQLADGRQHQRSAWYPAPPQRPYRGRHDQWLSPGHMSVQDDDNDQDGPWTDHAHAIVEEPDDNIANEATQLPRRPRTIEQDRTHGEQQMSEDEKWGPVGLGANYATRTPQPDICWSSLHSPSAYPHLHADPSQRAIPFSERRSHYSPPPSPSWYPAPEHVPYDRDDADAFAHSSRAQPIAGLTREDPFYASRDSQKLQRRTSQLCRMLRQQAKDLEAQETRVRKQQARMAKAVDVYFGTGRETSQ
ncbi:MAG: hypothetical protein LQ348_003948 [Seirophora lacunosa]|nr:MAG: hypothetical protein LQ348_003948 [Seirophora lacunosa]